MDMHNIHHQMKGKRSRKSIGGVRKPCVKDVMKVVYISTPMKVKTSASKFREIVQELTGRESDVVRIMEKYHVNNYNSNNTWMIPHNYHNNNNNHNFGDYCDGQEELMIKARNDHTVQIGAVLDDKTSLSSSSEEFIEQFDGVYMREQQSFGQFDHHTLLYDPIYNHIDALDSY